MKKLCKFYWDCGRMGEVEGIFVATEEEIRDAIGQEVYFGEILGKHSEVCGKLEECDIKILDISEKIIDELIPHLGTEWSGYNPLEYISY